MAIQHVNEPSKMSISSATFSGFTSKEVGAEDDRISKWGLDKYNLPKNVVNPTP